MMTEEQAELKAGPELDRVVCQAFWGAPCLSTSGYTPRFSTDIEFAWSVVEKLRSRGWTLSLSCNDFITEPWDCRFFLKETKRAIRHGRTAAEAICRAALDTLT